MSCVRHGSQVVDVDHGRLVGRRLEDIAIVMDLDEFPPQSFGGPQPVIRCEDSVIPMPVLPRRRHEIRERVEKLKRRKLENAVGTWQRGLSLSDPGRPSWRPCVAAPRNGCGRCDVCVASHRESLERTWRTGAGSHQVLEALKIAGHFAVDERHPHAAAWTGRRAAGQRVGNEPRPAKPLSKGNRESLARAAGSSR